MKLVAVAAGILAVLTSGQKAGAQGSWLPYGTLGASDITVTPSGVVWLVAREAGSTRSTLVLGETRFFTPAGTPERVAADANGFPWLVNSDGSVWHYVRTGPGKEEWQQVSLKAIDIAVGADGSVWAVDSEHGVVKVNADGTKSIGGWAARIAVDPSGNPWIVNSTGQVSQWTGTRWKSFGGSATDISIAPDGTVFILGTSRVPAGFEILRLNGSEWEHIVGGGGVAISAGSKAVFVAQFPAGDRVLSSENARLRVSQSLQVEAPAAAATNSAPQPSTSPTSSPQISNSTNTNPPTSSNSGQSGSSAQGDKGGSIPGAGAVGSGLGLLGGLLAKVAPAAAGVAAAGAGAVNPVPSPQAVAAAAGAAAGGAVAGAAIGAVGDVVGSAGSSVATGNQPQPGRADQSTPSDRTPEKSSALNNPLLNSAPPLPKIPISGKLTCPVIGAGAVMEKACEIGRDALRLRLAPSTECASPAFEESRNGGECWTCPVSFTRNSAASVDSANACLNSTTQSFSAATLVSGCATYKAPPGYGTPFRDAQAGNDCYVCPLPFKWSLTTLTHLSKGDLAACVGKGKDLLLWQLGQFPETGTYRFMPGLLSMALSDPQAVDAFLSVRAKGDSILKRQMWAKMIADPASSAELKALMFASLLKVAREDSASAQAKQTLTEFESYIRSRRFYVAQEAMRMYRKAREVDSLSASDASGTAITDFKTYAWSAALPDSAGTAFVLASAALSQLKAPENVDSLISARVSSLNASYLQPLTDALAVKVSDAALAGSTLLGSAMKASRGFLGLLGKDQLAAEYSKYLEQMSVPVRVKDLLESSVAEEKQSLMLYWALATSPHFAADKIGEGRMSGAELCAADPWTLAQCAAAREMVRTAAKAAGYTN